MPVFPPGPPVLPDGRWRSTSSPPTSKHAATDSAGNLGHERSVAFEDNAGMSDRVQEPGEERFWALAAPLLNQPGVTRSTMMGFACLRLRWRLLRHLRPPHRGPRRQAE